MTTFQIYLKLGFDHIADIAGYDHILFIATLCGIYLLYQWKQILILITAFTIGHTVTLALATLNIITISSALVEFLIPVTILITALANILHKSHEFSRGLHVFKYLTAVFFGLIHGLGFSNYLRALLGNEQSLFEPLLAFNIGLELGQIAIVFVVLFVARILINNMRVSRREWNLVISGAGLGISIILIIERLPELF